jgi:hypothetical protein
VYRPSAIDTVGCQSSSPEWKETSMILEGIKLTWEGDDWGGKSRWECGFVEPQAPLQAIPEHPPQTSVQLRKGDEICVTIRVSKSVSVQECE